MTGDTIALACRLLAKQTFFHVLISQIRLDVCDRGKWQYKMSEVSTDVIISSKERESSI